MSLHDDKLRFPGVYFVIVVVHGGRLGIVDHRSRAVRHTTGEIPAQARPEGENP